MRINLRCPYEEKEKVKALGARWDAAKKTWYVIDPEDLSKFSRWLTEEVKKFYRSNPPKKKPVNKYREVKPRFTVGKNYKPLCSCTIPPWEHCEHTEYQIPERGKDERADGNCDATTRAYSDGAISLHLPL